MKSAGLSFTEPPGLNHSALAYTSTSGNSLSNSLISSKGVLPIHLMIAESSRFLNALLGFSTVDSTIDMALVL